MVTRNSSTAHHRSAPLPGSDENAKLAIAAAGVAVWRWDITDDVFWLSGGARGLAMPSEGVLTGAGLLARVHPGDRRMVERALQDAPQRAPSPMSSFARWPMAARGCA